MAFLEYHVSVPSCLVILKFTICNKAIMLFDPSRNVSPQPSGRIQRWSLKLAM